MVPGQDQPKIKCFKGHICYKIITMNNNEILNLAKEQLKSGNLKQAEILYKEILKTEPNNINALHFVGIIHFHHKQYIDAINYLNKTLFIAPGYIDAHNNLGRIFQEIGKFDEAILCYQNSLKIDPNFIQAYMNLSIAYESKGDIDEAIEYLQKALSLNPTLFYLYNNLAVLLETKGQFKQAVACCQKALNLNPNFAEAYINLGAALQATGQLNDAIASFQKAVKLAPNSAYSNYNLALALLMSGDFEQGWEKFEWRKKIQELFYLEASCSIPLWDGRNITGSSILLLGEQGFGDIIQFVRYASLVAQQNAKVSIICPKELKSLFKNSKWLHEVIEYGEQLPNFDTYCHLLSLPFIFRTTVETIPTNIPYLYADQELIQKWKCKQQNDASQFKVGLVWSGNPKNYKLAYKSSKLSDFSSLSKLRNVSFYSLQKGDTLQEAQNPPEGMKFINYMDMVDDFSQTAALIMTLDLVISVDTAVAHLSGALGKPIWTLLPFESDWRWMLGREDSPWYPTMKLYRQSFPRDWTSVITDITKDLSKYLEAIQR